MNYRESIDYLYGLGNEVLAMKLGLRSISALASALNDPQLRFPAVHIAGTNGKGSTAAMISSIARCAGLRTGLYTSPHLVEITERVRVDGEEISPDQFARAATAVREAAEQLVKTGELPALPTFFEQVTAIGFLHFAERAVDLSVLEVGLGGRLDATNICRPRATAITTVGLDHQQYLGATLDQVAREKAGIIKPGVPLVVAPQPAEAMKAIEAVAAESNAPLVAVKESRAAIEAIEPGAGLRRVGFYRLRYQTEWAERAGQNRYQIAPSLRGRHQAINALTAIHLAETLGISRESIVEGIESAVWPGRLEMIGGGEEGPIVLLDGAHNADGARTLRAFLDEHLAGVPLTLIFAAMSDKAVAQMARILFPAAQNIIATRIPNPRATDPSLVASYAEGAAIVTESVDEALSAARRLTPDDGLICAAGSLYLIGEIKMRERQS